MFFRSSDASSRREESALLLAVVTAQKRTGVAEDADFRLPQPAGRALLPKRAAPLIRKRKPVILADPGGKRGEDGSRVRVALRRQPGDQLVARGQAADNLAFDGFERLQKADDSGDARPQALPRRQPQRAARADDQDCAQQLQHGPPSFNRCIWGRRSPSGVRESSTA